MDDMNKRSGSFIAQMRKQAGLTQLQLAEKIGVSDKAVSKWETGRGFPDVSVLEGLAEALGVSISEIVTGERCGETFSREDIDRAVTEALFNQKYALQKRVSVWLFVAAAFLAFAPLMVVGASTLLWWIVAVVLVLAGVLLHCVKLTRKLEEASRKVPDRSAAIFTLGLLVGALLLEIVPKGVALVFAAGPNEHYTKYTNYFSLLAFGYGDFAPIFTGVLTAAAIVAVAIRLALSLAGALKKGKAASVAAFVIRAGFVCSLIMYSADRFTLVRAAVSLLLLLAAFSGSERFAVNSIRRSNVLRVSFPS